jgi:hypothetical protein
MILISLGNTIQVLSPPAAAHTNASFAPQAPAKPRSHGERDLKSYLFLAKSKQH